MGHESRDVHPLAEVAVRELLQSIRQPDVPRRPPHGADPSHAVIAPERHVEHLVGKERLDLAVGHRHPVDLLPIHHVAPRPARGQIPEVRGLAPLPLDLSVRVPPSEEVRRHALAEGHRVHQGIGLAVQEPSSPVIVDGLTLGGGDLAADLHRQDGEGLAHHVDRSGVSQNPRR